MAALALELCSTLMADRRSSPNVGLTVRSKVLPQALALVKSSLLQGQALLVNKILFSIAQCVAVLCLAAGDQKCSSTVQMLTNILKDDNSNNSAKQHLALLCLGEIGRRKDLSSHAHIENIIIESFQSPFEEIKSAASYALGNIAHVRRAAVLALSTAAHNKPNLIVDKLTEISTFTRLICILWILLEVIERIKQTQMV